MTSNKVVGEAVTLLLLVPSTTTTYNDDITNGTNLEQIDNIFSINRSSFFQTYESFVPLYYDDDNEKTKKQREIFLSFINNSRFAGLQSPTF